MLLLSLLLLLLLLFLFLTVVQEKWTKSQTKAQGRFGDPYGKAGRLVPYTGELAYMVLVWFPFGTLSSLSLSTFEFE